jgi:L-rhamnose mutarotase
MKKIAFKMKLKTGFEEEYERRHNEIWPSLVQLLKEAGISDYSIFLDEETMTLFAVQKINETDSSIILENNEIMQKWWKFMSDIMDTNPDNSPVSKPLKKVFHLD